MLVGEIENLGLPQTRGKASPGFYPLGTAFAVRTSSLAHLLSACHTMTDNPDCTRWHITTQVDRQQNGCWAFDVNNMKEVAVGKTDPDNDIVVLTLIVSSQPFELDDTVPICPADKLTSVADECLFKTYYCAVEHIANDESHPPLAATPSESKKLFALKNCENGHLWLHGGLCGGSSGGVVVNQQGLAVGIHIASNSSGLTVPNVKENDVREGKKRRGDDMSVHSDSLANSHSSTQVVLLSQNLLVKSLL